MEDLSAPASRSLLLFFGDVVVVVFFFLFFFFRFQPIFLAVSEHHAPLPNVMGFVPHPACSMFPRGSALAREENTAATLPVFREEY